MNYNKKWEYVYNIIFALSFPINLWKSLKTHFYVNSSFVCYLGVKNNKRLEYYEVENIIFGTSYPINLSQSLKTHLYGKKIFVFFSRKQIENSYYVFNIHIFRIRIQNYNMTLLENTFHVNNSFDYFLIYNYNKKWEYVVDNDIFRIVLHDCPLIIFENTFLCKLFICFLFIREQQQKVRICCWQYHTRNILLE